MKPLQLNEAQDIASQWRKDNKLDQAIRKAEPLDVIKVHRIAEQFDAEQRAVIARAVQLGVNYK